MENALMVVASVIAAGLIGSCAAIGAALGNSRVTSTTIAQKDSIHEYIRILT